jgi:hypothetical protein
MLKHNLSKAEPETMAINLKRTSVMIDLPEIIEKAGELRNNNVTQAGLLRLSKLFSKDLT